MRNIFRFPFGKNPIKHLIIGNVADLQRSFLFLQMVLDVLQLTVVEVIHHYNKMFSFDELIHQERADIASSSSYQNNSHYCFSFAAIPESSTCRSKATTYSASSGSYLEQRGREINLSPSHSVLGSETSGYLSR